MRQSKRQLVLENRKGQVVRIFNWTSDAAYLVHRDDVRRIEVYENLLELDEAEVPYQVLGQLKKEELLKAPYQVEDLGVLKFIDRIENAFVDPEWEEDSHRLMWALVALLLIVNFSIVYKISRAPQRTAAMEEKLKSQIVRIIKKVEVPKNLQMKDSISTKTNQMVKAQPTKTNRAQVSHMGALGVLGKLNATQKGGGLNLGAVQTSRGPGLGGGTQGSGGVQTTLYGKGIIGAPLGAGGNPQGAGGYGTHGKGGGQEGYGRLSLAGAGGSGKDMVPLGRDAIVDGGLDRDLIAEVILKNSGQIRFCYEQGLQLDPKLAGRVAVQFVIGGDGLVKASSIQNTTLNAKNVEDCIQMRLRSWKFPLPQGGVEVKVSYPFVLRRLGQG